MRRGRRGRRRPGGPRRRRDRPRPRLLRRRRPRWRRRDVRHRQRRRHRRGCGARGRRPPPRRGRPRRAAVLRLHEAGDRRDQRPGGRGGHHDDAARSTCGSRRATAKFGFVFARRGLVPEACSSWFLPRVVGISRAMEWCATGRVFGPDEALAGGLVRSVHEPDDLLPAAYALAPRSRRARRRCRSRSPGRCCGACSASRTRWRAHRIDSALVDALGPGADVREGVLSFLQKRPPEFPNRVPQDLPPRYPWWDEPAF